MDKKDFEKLKVSVVFPTYNEKENIVEAIERTSKSLGKALHEIIVVDDNSPDLTWKVVAELKNPKCKVIKRMKKRGLASAIAAGIKEAKGNVIVWLDCDLGIPPEEIPRLVEKMDKYDVAIGSRYVKGGGDSRPLLRSFYSVAVNFISGIFLGFKIKDYTSGFAAVKREVFDKVSFSTRGFGEYFIEFAFKSFRKGFKIIEVGYVYRDRPRGKSNTEGFFKILKLSFQYILRILRLFFQDTVGNI